MEIGSLPSDSRGASWTVWGSRLMQICSPEGEQVAHLDKLSLISYSG